MSEQEAITRILARDELSSDDVKAIMRLVRYGQERDKSIDYANTILPEAGDYLQGHYLRALVRADIPDSEASSHLEQNRLFFGRLASLLPELVRFFSAEVRTTNLKGLISTIDSCHIDFYHTAALPRKDRRLREAKEDLARASKLAADLVSILEETEDQFKHEFQRYYAVYYPARHVNRYLKDFIDELRMCSGVTEIASATVDFDPKRMMLFSNDVRKPIVADAYHMCTIWDGPKLVTTPGSDFSVFCGLLFEAVSGRSDEGLSGAINRYARSDDRRQWDREGEEDLDDNFMQQKNAMRVSAQQIELCEKLLQNADFSDVARVLLCMRIDHEHQEYEKARTVYGPHQVYLDRINKEQLMNMVVEAYNRWTPEQRLEFDEHMSSGKTLAELDIELGQLRRSGQGGKIDI
jgi:hypothetical protein